LICLAGQGADIMTDYQASLIGPTVFTLSYPTALVKLLFLFIRNLRAVFDLIAEGLSNNLSSFISE
jgi:hypothetical protein